jgi:hypothetical protein
MNYYPELNEKMVSYHELGEGDRRGRPSRSHPKHDTWNGSESRENNGEVSVRMALYPNYWFHHGAGMISKYFRHGIRCHGFNAI